MANKFIEIEGDYCPLKLMIAKGIVFHKAIIRSSGCMALCANANSYDGSYLGFVGRNGLLYLSFMWNEGVYTKAVCETFNIKRGNDDGKNKANSIH